MFANAVQSSETNFVLHLQQKEDYGKFGSIASMVYSDGKQRVGEQYALPLIRWFNSWTMILKQLTLN